MNYVDTSVLVAGLTTEAHTARAERLLTAGRGDALSISEWTIAEFSSALSAKLRTGSIDATVRDAALKALATMIADSLILLPVLSTHFRIAARFVDRHESGLRAPDALHLAIASDQGAVLCTLDKRLAAAGKIFGIAARLL